MISDANNITHYDGTGYWATWRYKFQGRIIRWPTWSHVVKESWVEISAQFIVNFLRLIPPLAQHPVSRQILHMRESFHILMCTLQRFFAIPFIGIATPRRNHFTWLFQLLVGHVWLFVYRWISFCVWFHKLYSPIFRWFRRMRVF